MIQRCLLSSLVSILMLQLILTVNLIAAFRVKPFIEQKQSVIAARRRKLNDSEFRPCSRDKPLSSSPDFLELETERVFQLYMKSRIDMNYYKPSEQRCQDDDTMSEVYRADKNNQDSPLRSSMIHSGEIPRAVREQITERDRRSYEKWRVIIASLREEESRDASPKMPFSLPSNPYPTQPKFLAVPASTSSAASLPYPSYTMLHDIPDDDYII